MTSPSPGDTTNLSRIVRVVEGHGQRLTLYNTNASREVLNDIQRYFSTTSVELRRGRTDDGLPQNFAVLHEDEEFIAACDLSELHAATDPTGPWIETDEPRRSYPDLLTKIDQSVFKEYGKRRMILASREIEKRAWHARPSALHVGFQEFSRLDTQLPLYRKLAAELDVHLYGVPDREPPLDSITLHGYDTEELQQSWFVVIEPDAETPEERARSLLAEEREPNHYFGFWTSHDEITNRVLDRLAKRYPANDPF